MITEKDKKEYVENSGVLCPYCHSDNLDGGERNSDDGFMTQEVKCLDCDKSWTDIYKLVSIQE